MVRAYVETLLKQLLGAPSVTADDDGDYPVRYRDALYYIRLVGENHPVVQVFSIAVADIESSPELLEAINEMNTDIRFARAFWVRGQVLVEADLVSDGLDPADFDNACQTVASITDYFAPKLAERFGGKTAFADETGEQYESPRPNEASPYL